MAAIVAIFLNLSRLPLMVQETGDRSATETVLEKSPESTPVQQIKRQANAVKKARTMEHAELYGAGSVGLDADSWLDILQKNCLAGRQDTDFLARYGRAGAKNFRFGRRVFSS